MNAQVLVADTSVFIKWYRQHEEYATEALALRDAYLAGEILLVEPDLSLVEFANVMRFMDELSTEQVQLAVESLFAFPIRWVQPTEEMMARAVAIAREHGRTAVYDALFAAVAEAYDALFVTADMRFARAAPDLTYIRALAGFRLA
jgi:predicted nucleic acid-binding protein